MSSDRLRDEIADLFPEGSFTTDRDTVAATVRGVVGQLQEKYEQRLEEMADFAGQMSEARRRADAATDRLRDFALRLSRMDDVTDATGVEDRRRVTLDEITRGAREALDATSDYVAGAPVSRETPATDVVPMERRYQHLLASIWLHVSWRYVTSQLTTDQKNLWADAVDAMGDAEDGGTTVDRWWNDHR